MCSKTRHTTTASNDGVGERERVGVGPGVVDRTAPFVRSAQLRGSRVDAHDEPGAVACDQPRDLSLTGAHIEHPLRAGQALAGERQDLLFVLRVGAVGESLLPPTRVALPEIVTHAAAIFVRHGDAVSA